MRNRILTTFAVLVLAAIAARVCGAGPSPTCRPTSGSVAAQTPASSTAPPSQDRRERDCRDWARRAAPALRRRCRRRPRRGTPTPGPRRRARARRRPRRRRRRPRRGDTGRRPPSIPTPGAGPKPTATCSVTKDSAGFFTRTSSASSYVAYVPASYDGTAPMRLIVGVHGCGDNAMNFATWGVNPYDTRATQNHIGISVGGADGRCWNASDDAKVLAAVDDISSCFWVHQKKVVDRRLLLGRRALVSPRPLAGLTLRRHPHRGLRALRREQQSRRAPRERLVEAEHRAPHAHVRSGVPAREGEGRLGEDARLPASRSSRARPRAPRRHEHRLGHLADSAVGGVDRSLTL